MVRTAGEESASENIVVAEDRAQLIDTTKDHCVEALHWAEGLHAQYWDAEGLCSTSGHG
jgi:hypothetical protein